MPLLKAIGGFLKDQAISSSFALALFGLLALSNIPGLPLARYDFLLLGCLAVQWLLIRVGWEDARALKVISLFHLAGLALELIKVSLGSWAYPEPALTKIVGVPLYSGFMYAAVASYMLQAWRRLSLQVEHWPRPWLAGSAVALIYGNFLLNRFLGDWRWPIAAFIAAVFARSTVGFSAGALRLHMPLILSFLLIGFAVWIAEQVCTGLGAWVYPHQAVGWSPVGWGKLSSWCLLVILSLVIIRPLAERRAGAALQPN